MSHYTIAKAAAQEWGKAKLSLHYTQWVVYGLLRWNEEDKYLEITCFHPTSVFKSRTFKAKSEKTFMKAVQSFPKYGELKKITIDRAN